MFDPKDELDPPFEILEPAEWRGPVIFNSPHSGSVYPRTFLSTSRLDTATLRSCEDSFVDELTIGVVRGGSGAIVASCSRIGSAGWPAPRPAPPWTPRMRGSPWQR